MIGSGPFRFVADERVPGSRVVYAKIRRLCAAPGRRGRASPPVRRSCISTAWCGHFIPDPATAAAALQQGEFDWWENPPIDLRAACSKPTRTSPSR